VAHHLHPVFFIFLKRLLNIRPLNGNGCEVFRTTQLISVSVIGFPSLESDLIQPELIPGLKVNLNVIALFQIVKSIRFPFDSLISMIASRFPDVISWIFMTSVITLERRPSGTSSMSSETRSGSSTPHSKSSSSVGSLLESCLSSLCRRIVWNIFCVSIISLLFLTGVSSLVLSDVVLSSGSGVRV